MFQRVFSTTAGLIVFAVMAASAQAQLVGGILDSGQSVDGVETSFFGVECNHLEAWAVGRVRSMGGTFNMRILTEWYDSSNNCYTSIPTGEFTVEPSAFYRTDNIGAFDSIDYPDDFDSNYKCKFTWQYRVGQIWFDWQSVTLIFTFAS